MLTEKQVRATQRKSPKTCKKCVYQGTKYCQFENKIKDLMAVYPDIEIAPCSSFKPRERKRNGGGKDIK